MAAESGDAQLAELGGALLSRADELSDTMTSPERQARCGTPGSP
jgi:hypothetical protein